MENILEVEMRESISDLYKTLRTNKSSINFVLGATDSMIQECYKLGSEEGKRAISFIGLKYDILLETDLTLWNVNNFKKEVVDFLKFRQENYDKNLVSLKILESLFRISYACKLLEIPGIVDNEYRNILKNFAHKFDYFFDNEFEKNDERRNMPSMFYKHGLFYFNLYKENALTVIFYELLKDYKKHKFEYYNYSQEEQKIELKNYKKYSFIWKE